MTQMFKMLIMLITMLLRFQVHLSFSLYGAENGGVSPQLQWQFLRLFLESVGIVLTDIQDVVFKSVMLLPYCCHF